MSELLLSNLTYRTALDPTIVFAPMITDNYREEMQEKIDAAEGAARYTHEVTIRVSRQTYRDLVEAYRFLRQVNPWYKSIGKRLERLGIDIRDKLDRIDAPSR